MLNIFSIALKLIKIGIIWYIISIKIYFHQIKLGIKMKEKNQIQKLLSLFSNKEKKKALMLLILSIITALFQAIGVFSIFPFIDIIINPSLINTNEMYLFFYNLLNFQTDVNFIIFLGSIIFVVMVSSNMLTAFTLWYKNNFIFNQNHVMSQRLLSNYLEMDYEFFLNRNTGDLSKNILMEINILTQRYLISIFDVIVNVLILVFVVGVIIIVNPIVTITALTSLGLIYFLINFFIKKNLKKKGEERRAANRKRFKMASEALSSIKITKMLGVENFFLNRYAVYSKEYAKANKYASIAGQLPKYIIEAIAFGGLILYLIIELLLGNDIINIIPLISILALASYRILPSIQAIYNSVSQIYYHGPILEKIYEDTYFFNKKEVNPLKENIEPISFNNKITIDKLTFSYKNSEDKFIINNLSLEINKGEVIGFIGKSGIGKTTLVDILMGLLEPVSGNIKIDHKIIDLSNLKSWQKLIGYVPQEIYLSDDTVANNIAFGIKDSNIDLKMVEEAAKLASLDDFIINGLKQKYDTIVGERGVRLSGGERQRIGLARALYKNPSVLILDEATSSLDYETENEVLKAIEIASKNRTVIMIAHRITTLKNCDKIYEIKNDKILLKKYEDLSKE